METNKTPLKNPTPYSVSKTLDNIFADFTYINNNENIIIK